MALGLEGMHLIKWRGVAFGLVGGHAFVIKLRGVAFGLEGLQCQT